MTSRRPPLFHKQKGRYSESPDTTCMGRRGSSQHSCWLIVLSQPTSAPRLSRPRCNTSVRYTIISMYGSWAENGRVTPDARGFIGARPRWPAGCSDGGRSRAAHMKQASLVFLLRLLSLGLLVTPMTSATQSFTVSARGRTYTLTTQAVGTVLAPILFT